MAKKILVLIILFVLLYTYLSIFSTIAYAEDLDTEIIEIVENLPRYYAVDIEEWPQADNLEGHMIENHLRNIESYIENLIKDNSLDVQLHITFGSSGSLLYEFCDVDVEIYKNSELKYKKSFKEMENTQIVMVALVSVLQDINENETAYIEYGESKTEPFITNHRYYSKYTYSINHNLPDEIKNENIVFLDTYNFGTIKYNEKDITSNIYSITSQEYGGAIPLLIMQSKNLDVRTGDINGDGKVNIKDWNLLYNHINETELLTGYQLLCADINGDGKVNIKDWNRMYDHITEVNPLF